MNETVVSVKKRVVRSELELDQLCNIMWLSSLGCVLIIHSETLALEGYRLAVNVLIALGVLAVGLTVMKLCQPLNNAMLKRSKKFDFVDDIKNPNLHQDRFPAVSMYGIENSPAWKLPRGSASLLLMMTLYIVVVVLSFGYKSSVFFYAALASSMCIVASAVFLFVKEKSSGKTTAKENGSSGLQGNIDSSTTPELLDSQISWIVRGRENTQFRISRMWLGENLLRIGIWVPFVLAIPLIGPLFVEFFWIALGVGFVYLFLLEMCTLVIFSKVRSRILAQQ